MREEVVSVSVQLLVMQGNDNLFCNYPGIITFRIRDINMNLSFRSFLSLFANISYCIVIYGRIVVHMVVVCCMPASNPCATSHRGFFCNLFTVRFHPVTQSYKLNSKSKLEGFSA